MKLALVIEYVWTRDHFFPDDEIIDGVFCVPVSPGEGWQMCEYQPKDYKTRWRRIRTEEKTHA